MPVTCLDVDGDFPGPHLTPDDSTPLPDDPNLSFSPVGGGKIEVRFEGDSKSFPVTCNRTGKHVVVNFSRTDSTGQDTDYTAIFARIKKANGNTYLRFRGRFERITGREATLNGDWETEKPT